MDEDMWLAAADYLPSSNSSKKATKPQHLQAAGRASGDESEDDTSNSKSVFVSSTTRADAEQSVVVGAGVAVGLGVTVVGVAGANLRARRPSSLVPPSTPSSTALLEEEEADDEDDEDDTIPATPATPDNAVVPSVTRAPKAGRRLSQSLLEDISRLKLSMQEQAKQSSGIVGQFASWLTCFWQGSDSPPAEGPAARPSTFEIRFEDVQELKWIGAGAHGCVFLGTYNHEEVAVKKLREKSMTMREVRLLRTLRHENIVELKGVCTQPPVYCLVMEYCPKSLHDAIRDTKIAAPMVLDWARQIANGMHYLHEKGMVHRDLKSPNILIAQDKRTLKISDFGTCRELKSGGHSTKMSFSGTVAWMAPEIIRSEACTDKIDVWSYGVCLWELLTGEMPYKGVDVGAVVYGVGSGKLTLPIPQSAPDGFTLLLKQCWNTQPKHRPSFRQIMAHLDILRDDTEFAATPDDEFFHTQVRWRREIVERYEEMRLAESQLREHEARLVRQREEELQHAAEVRELYEKKLLETTQLLQELREMENRLRKRDRDLERRLSTAARRAPNSAKKKNGRGGRDNRRKRRSAGSAGSGSWEHLATQDVVVHAPARSANGLSDELQQEWSVLEPAATVTTSLA